MIDLAESAGLVLDPWQRFVLHNGLGQLPDEEWTAKRVGCWVPRQNGKGGIIEALELAWLFLFGEDLIIHSAHEHKTSAKAYRRLERIIRANVWMHRKVKQYRQTNGEQRIELRDGRMLEYHTRSGTAIRGFSAGKLVLDEAQELNSDQMAAVGPTISAMRHWQMWFFGTPPRDGTAWCYGLRDGGEAGRPRLAWFDWGADLDPEDPLIRELERDRDLWWVTNPALGIRIEETTVEDECGISGLSDKFPAERLGVWPKRVENGGLIDEAAWKALTDADSRRTGAVVFGVDLNPKRTHASITAWGLREDAREHGELVEYRPGTKWVAGRCRELREKHHPHAFALDRTGPAGSLVDALDEVGITVPEDPEHPHKGHLAIPTTAQFAAACGQMLDAITDREFAHIGQPELTKAALGASPRNIGEATGFGRRASEVDISPLVALTVARWAFRAIDPGADYDLLESVW